MKHEKKSVISWYIRSWVTLGFLTGCSTNNQQEEAISPNIIFIMADDLCYNELGCYGQEIIKTPGIDRRTIFAGLVY